MSALQLIASGNFISVNRTLIKKLGLDEAVVYGELASEYDYWSKNNGLVDGYFFSTIENLEDKTSLKEKKQKKVLQKLQDLNLIDVKLKGLPAKRYIKINEAELLELLDIFSSVEMAKLEQSKRPTNNNINNKNINNNVEKISKPTKKELLTMEQFGELWNMYPRKDGKKKSFDYINKSIKDGATIEQIKNGILGYVKDIKEKGTEPKYIKMGSTFFNQECWRDYEPIQDKEKQEFKLENEEQKETESFDNTLINGFLK